MPRQNADILKNVISVAANGDAPAFYQPYEFAILQDAYALKFKGEELNSRCYLYLTSLLQKVLQKYNWNDKSGWSKVSQEFIALPVYANNEFAFDFMEKYIQELEQERIQELEAYLLVAGLKDTKLSEKEKKLCESSQSFKILAGGGKKLLFAA